MKKLREQYRRITNAAAGKHHQHRHEPQRAPGALLVPLRADQSVLQLHLRLRAPVEHERFQKSCMLFSFAHSSIGRALVTQAVKLVPCQGGEPQITAALKNEAEVPPIDYFTASHKHSSIKSRVF